MTAKNYLFLFLGIFIPCLLSANTKADHEYDYTLDSIKNGIIEKLLQTHEEELHLKNSMDYQAYQKVIERSHKYNTAYAFILYAPGSTDIHNIYKVQGVSNSLYSGNYIGFRIKPIEQEDLAQSTYFKCLPVQNLNQPTWKTILAHSTLIFPKQSKWETFLFAIKPGPIPVPVPFPFYALKAPKRSQMEITLSTRINKIKATDMESSYKVEKSTWENTFPQRTVVTFKWNMMKWNNSAVTSLIMADEDFASHFKPCSDFLN